jgi:ABC-type nitrate/sulfonate/bicarbonate transport system substrate-binding protein
VPALINANAAGLPVQGVVDIQTTIDDPVKGQALQKWYTRCDSGINTLKDVEGKKFGINLIKSSFNYTALMAMQQQGVDPEKVEWVLLSFDKQIPALENGSIDVAGLMQPYQNYVDQQYAGKFCELMNDRDDVFHGTRHVSLTFVNRIWAQNNPETAKAFVAGIVDAIKWIETHQDEAKAIQAKYTGIPVESIPVYHYTENGAVRMEDVSAWMDFLAERGDLTADWLKPEDVGTNDYQP